MDALVSAFLAAQSKLAGQGAMRVLARSEISLIASATFPWLSALKVFCVFSDDD